MICEMAVMKNIAGTSSTHTVIFAVDQVACGVRARCQSCTVIMMLEAVVVVVVVKQ